MHLEELIGQASRRARTNTDRQPAARLMQGLELFQRNTRSAIEASLYEPVICLILQGRKELSIGGETLSVGPGECLLVSHHLPVTSRITKAPYMSLVLQVDVAIARRLYDEVEEFTLHSEQGQAAETHRADAGLLDALGRYLSLADSTPDARVLGPLILKEIHYRLLAAPFGGMLRNLIRHDSDASTIARAIGHIRGDIRLPIVIPELARRVGMSVSSFHKHFKTITSTTPLQYQKELRLLEAQRLIKTGSTSVTTAAFAVGYESPSQFSREYARKFGVPPRQDLATVAG